MGAIDATKSFKLQAVNSSGNQKNFEENSDHIRVLYGIANIENKKIIRWSVQKKKYFLLNETNK